MQKRFHLTKGNSKWIAVGVTPAAKIISSEAPGFYCEILIAGGSSRAMVAGGINGFLNICRALRTIEQFKYSYPASKCDYDLITSEIPMSISEAYFNGALTYKIVNMNNGEMGYLAMATVMELMKVENLILAAANTLSSLADDAEKKFIDLATKCSSDFAATLKDIEKSGDLLCLEIATNFTDLLKLAIEEVTRINYISESTKEANKQRRARASNKAPAAKRQKIQKDSSSSISPTPEPPTLETETTLEVDDDEEEITMPFVNLDHDYGKKLEHDGQLITTQEINETFDDINSPK